MYRAFFGLDKDPFSLDPDLAFLYLSKPHEEAIAHLAYGLEQEEDIVLITGDIGTGKTMALHRLLEQASGIFTPVFINVTSLDFEQLLRLIMLKLGVEDRTYTGVAELLHGLERVLVETRQQGKKILLVVDEAQNFPLEVLESIRMLLNLARPGEQAVQLVLVGQLGLEQMIASPALRQFRQRIRVSYRFEHLTRDETVAYIRHRLEVAGCQGDIFKGEAIDRIHRLSRGVPRLVNHHASQALLAAYVDDKRKVGAHHVEPDEVSATATAVPAAAPAPEPTPAPPPSPPAFEPAPPLPEEVDIPIYADRARRSSGRGRIVAVVAFVAVLLAATAYLTVDSWRPLLESLRSSGTAAPQAAAPGPAVAVEDSVVEADSAPETPIDVAAAQPETPPVQEQAPPVTAAPVDSTTVHVSSFATRDRATAFRRKLDSMGYPAFVNQTRLENGRIWFRVYIGPYAAETDARAAVSDLQRGGTITSYYAVTRGRPADA